MQAPSSTLEQYLKKPLYRGFFYAYKTITMKMRALVISTAIIIALPGMAQRSKPVSNKEPKNVIKTNLLPTLGGQIPFTNEYRLVYERKTGERTALQVTGAYLGKSPFVGLFERYAINIIDENVKLGVGGYRVQAAYKFYFLKNQPGIHGFYLAPSLSYAYAKIRDTNKNDDFFKASYSSASALAGYQFIIGGHFAVDVFTGIGIKYNHYGVNIPVNESNFEFNRLDRVGPKFWLGFNMGYAF
jgi:hypothetical protein